MQTIELQHLKVDKTYLFKLKDGREIRRSGGWLMTCESGRWEMDKRKCEHVESYKEL